MKAKPQIHFWVEHVGVLTNGVEIGKPGYKATRVYALNACRGWDVPANGVFMLFMHEELWRWSKDFERYFMRPGPRDLVVKKLEAREEALENYYGREVKHHRDQFELTPAERRESQHRKRGASDSPGGDHVVSAHPGA